MVVNTIKCTQVYEIIVYTLYNYYTFREIMKPNSAGCVTVDRAS